MARGVSGAMATRSNLDAPLVAGRFVGSVSLGVTEGRATIRTATMGA